MTRSRDLTRGPIAPGLLGFALPTLGSMVLQSLSASINTFWVGRFLGPAALAATTNAHMLMFLLTAFAYGLGLASTIFVGQAMGRRDVTHARRIMGTTFSGLAAVAVVIAVLGWQVTLHLLVVLDTPHEVLPLAIAYLQVIFLGIPGVLLLTLLMMALRGTGDSATPLVFVGLSVLLDLVLNPLLILGVGPVPALGIAGSALATAIANYVSLFALLAYIQTRDLAIRLRGAEFRYLWPDLNLLKQIVRAGIPLGLEMIVMTVAVLSILSLTNREGLQTTAALGVAMQVWTYIQMPALAVSAAVSAMAAQTIGAGNTSRLPQIVRTGGLVGVLVTALTLLMLYLADGAIIGLFVSRESPAHSIARHIQRLAGWGFLFFAMSSVLLGVVRASGRTFWPLVIVVIAMFPVRLGVAYGFYPSVGADALWLSFPAGMVAIWVMSLLMFLEGGWRRAPSLAHVAPELIQPPHEIGAGEALTR